MGHAKDNGGVWGHSSATGANSYIIFAVSGGLISEKAFMGWAAEVAANAADAKLPPENERGFDCGFAWVHAPEVRLNTKAGKQLLALGYTKHWPGGARLWYSKIHNVHTQSISVHMAAVEAYADVIKDNEMGIRFVTGSHYN